MAKSEDLTKTAAWRQMSAMACMALEVGVRNGDSGLMMRRQWAPSEVLHFLPWLKSRNARGADIYIQPAPDLMHGLVLVDDLSSQAIAKLVADGLTPACTVETSRANFQVWVKIAPVVPPALRTVIARRLARDYEGDLASVGAAHFGRLAGFTNCKPQRVDADGRRSFVLCRTWDGAVAPAGAQMLAWAVRQQASLSHAPAGRAVCEAGRSVGASATGDQSRADFARACGLARAGRGVADIAAALAAVSPRIAARKRGHVGDYCQRTAEAAVRAVTAAVGRSRDDRRAGAVCAGIEAVPVRNAEVGMKTYEGHPVHLDDGLWGVKVEGNGHEAVAVGDRLTVKSKAGMEWGATVTRVVDHNDYGTRVEAKNDPKATAASASPLSATGAPAVSQDSPQ